MIVLYDGDCGICKWSVAWALARDREGVLTVAPIQSATGARLLADLPPEERLRSAHVVYPDGRRESAGAAARAVLEALPSADALARLTGASPRATEVVYRWIADHRSLVSRLVPADAKRRAAGVVDAAAVR